MVNIVCPATSVGERDPKTGVIKLITCDRCPLENSGHCLIAQAQNLSQTGTTPITLTREIKNRCTDAILACSGGYGSVDTELD